MQILDTDILRQLLLPRPKDGHKGTFGHALIIAGKYGMAGASVLSARAALRSGVGKVSIHAPRLNNDILQIAVPEAILHHDSDAERFATPTDTAQYDALAIGPGIGTAEVTACALGKQLACVGTKPLVLDADALNIIGLQHREWLNALPPQAILTPHGGEYVRLAGTMPPADFASHYNVILVAKGFETRIYMPDGEVWQCPWGNDGMATAGSGDVLTGILVALLAQGYSPASAALLGVSLHALAGDKAAALRGNHAVIASDIIDNLSVNHILTAED